MKKKDGETAGDFLGRLEEKMSTDFREQRAESDLIERRQQHERNAEERRLVRHFRAATIDLVSSLFYYDRKEDEDLNDEQVTDLVSSGVVTRANVLGWFRDGLDCAEMFGEARVQEKGPKGPQDFAELYPDPDVQRALYDTYTTAYYQGIKETIEALDKIAEKLETDEVDQKHHGFLVQLTKHLRVLSGLE